MKKLNTLTTRMLSLLGIMILGAVPFQAYAEDELPPISAENPPLVMFDTCPIWDIDEDMYSNWYYGWDEEDIALFGDIEFVDPSSYEVRHYALDEDFNPSLAAAYSTYAPSFSKLLAPGLYNILAWSGIDGPEGTHHVTIDESDPNNIFASVQNAHDPDFISYSPEMFYSRINTKLGLTEDTDVYDWYDEEEGRWVKSLHIDLVPAVQKYLVQLILHNNRGRIVGAFQNATVSGLASGINLSSFDDDTMSFEHSDVPVTHQFGVRLKKGLDKDGEVTDIMGGAFNTYGACADKNVKQNLSYYLSASNGTSKKHVVDISQQIARNPSGGIITIEIDVDTLYIPQNNVVYQPCFGNQGGFDSDPSLPFSVRIASNVEPIHVGNKDFSTRGTMVYNKYIDFKGTEDQPHNVSWKVTRYSGILGDPLSDNPADWVPVSYYGVPCYESPYMAVIETGNNLQFEKDKFQSPFYDIVLQTMYGCNGFNPANGIPGHLLDNDPDHIYDQNYSMGGSNHNGCYFYALEVTVDGQTGLARTPVQYDFYANWMNNLDFPIHSNTHILQVFDKEYAEAEGVSTINPSDEIDYEALAFEEETRSFYYINYSNPDAAVMVPSTDSESLIQTMFDYGPVLPHKYLVYQESMSNPGFKTTPSKAMLAMRCISPYIKFWDLGVQIGTPTNIGLILDVWESFKFNKYTDYDLYSWANACQLHYGINRYNLIFARPYLPQARLDNVEFMIDDLGVANSVTSQDVINKSETPTEYNNVKHYMLSAKVSGLIPRTPNTVESPRETSEPISIITKIQGIEVTLGKRAYTIDLDKAHLSEDGTFEATISGLDPKEILDDNDMSTVTAYISNTKWYTWAPMNSLGNFNNEWNVYSPNHPVLQVDIASQFVAPTILAVDMEERGDRQNWTKSLYLNSVSVAQAPTTFHDTGLEENLILSVGDKGSDERRLVTLDDGNPIHAHTFFEEYNNLGINLGTIEYTTQWPVQELRLAHAYFFDVTQFTVEGGENTVVTGATVTDPNSLTRHPAVVRNKSNHGNNVAPANRAAAINTINHSSFLSPVGKFEYTVSDTTGVEDIVEGDNGYSINGRQVTVTADNVDIYNTAGIGVANQPGTYTLQPGFYIINNGTTATTIAVK